MSFVEKETTILGRIKNNTSVAGLWPGTKRKEKGKERLVQASTHVPGFCLVLLITSIPKG